MTKLSKKTIALILILIVATGAASFIYINQSKIDTPEEIAEQNHAKNDSSESKNSLSGGQLNNSDQPAGNTTEPPDPPILIKSSGNNGSVLQDANIEFVCQSKEGNSCKLVLISAGNKASPITLEPKIIGPNRSGQPGINWYWSAVKGTWSVTAIASNSSGNSASSAPQIMEVR